MESPEPSAKFDVNIDQRMNPRFSPPTETYAATGDNFSRVGRVVNISVNGLLFEYVIAASSFDGLYHSQVDIFSTDGAFHLSRIPCRVIHDAMMASTAAGINRHTNFVVRRCRIELKALRFDQEAKLERFIFSQTA